MANQKIPNLADCPAATLVSKLIQFAGELGYRDLLIAWREKNGDDPYYLIHKIVQLLLDLGHEPLVLKWLEEAQISIDLKNRGYDISNVIPLVQKGGEV